MGVKAVCSECGKTEVVPIIYGLPGPELIEAADRGEVILAGCIVYDDAPTHQCQSCDMTFFIEPDPVPIEQRRPRTRIRPREGAARTVRVRKKMSPRKRER